MLGKTSASVECSSVFKKIIFLFLMFIGVTQNPPSISSRLDIFQNLNFITFGFQTLSANEVHRASFKLFQLNNIPIQPQQ